MLPRVPRARRPAIVTVKFAPLGLAILIGLASPQTASAQFGFFGQDGISAQDAYDTIAAHGFRLAGPMMRNSDVYIADVVDRRQRRERLIISRSSGQIVQRFMVDMANHGPYAALPGSPAGAALPRRPAASEDPGFFSRMVRGWSDDDPPRPPANVDTDNDAVAPRTLPRQQRIARPRLPDAEPRVATRREDPPITAKPLAPAPTALPDATATIPTGSTQAPQATSPATPPPARATVVSTDPLRIPGVKDHEPAKISGTTLAAKPVAPAGLAPKPVAEQKAVPSGDVPVAPLD